jgi:Flp pilus assembly protein TadD
MVDELLQKSLLDYNRVIELEPNKSRAYNDRAIIVQQLGRTEDAIAGFFTLCSCL